MHIIIFIHRKIHIHIYIRIYTHICIHIHIYIHIYMCTTARRRASDLRARHDESAWISEGLTRAES